MEPLEFKAHHIEGVLTIINVIPIKILVVSEFIDIFEDFYGFLVDRGI